MSNTFHNKFHRYNHMSAPMPGITDMSLDPIASRDVPFLGEFVMGNEDEPDWCFESYYNRLGSIETINGEPLKISGDFDVTDNLYVGKNITLTGAINCASGLYVTGGEHLMFSEYMDPESGNNGNLVGFVGFGNPNTEHPEIEPIRPDVVSRTHRKTKKQTKKSARENYPTFDLDGLRYSILSEDDRTVGIAYPSPTGGFNPGQSFTIPSAVENDGVEYTVVEICSNCFANCSALADVEVEGDTLEKIGEYAFYGSSVESVSVSSEALVEIGKYCFSNCEHIVNCQLSDSLEELPESCFCESTIDDFSVPRGIKKIGDYCFYGCNSLNRVTYNESIVEEFGDYCFYNCLLNDQEFKIPESCKKIGERCFNGSRIKNVVIPSGVEEIGESAFLGCIRLKNVVIKANITEIPKLCFGSCTLLTNITIPDSVASFGNFAFSGSSLTEINFPKSLVSIGDGCFQSCKFTNMIIPNGVTTIGKQAFYGCNMLNYIDIPESVTSIGDECFVYCNILRLMVFGGNAPELGNDVFVDTGCLTVGDNQIHIKETATGFNESQWATLKSSSGGNFTEHYFVKTKFIYNDNGKIDVKYNETVKNVIDIADMNLVGNWKINNEPVGKSFVWIDFNESNSGTECHVTLSDGKTINALSGVSYNGVKLVEIYNSSKNLEKAIFNGHVVEDTGVLKVLPSGQLVFFGESCTIGDDIIGSNDCRFALFTDTYLGTYFQ